MPEKVFGSRVDMILNAELTGGSFRDSTIHSYTVVTDSRLWIMRALIRGEHLQLLADDYQNTKLFVTIQRRLDKTHPGTVESGPMFDFVSDRVASFPIAPGELDVWIRVENNGNNSVFLDDSIEVGFLVVPDAPGFPE